MTFNEIVENYNFIFSGTPNPPGRSKSPGRLEGSDPAAGSQKSLTFRM
eukprot:UN08216